MAPLLNWTASMGGVEDPLWTDSATKFLTHSPRRYRYQYGWYSLDLHLEVFGFVSTLAGIEPPPSCVGLLASATMPNESSLKVWCSLLTT